MFTRLCLIPSLLALARTPCSCVLCVVPSIVSTSPCDSGTVANGFFAPLPRYRSNNLGGDASPPDANEYENIGASGIRSSSASACRPIPADASGYQFTCAATPAAKASRLASRTRQSASSTHADTSRGHASGGSSTRALTCAPNLYRAPNVACLRLMNVFAFRGFRVRATRSLKAQISA